MIVTNRGRRRTRRTLLASMTLLSGFSIDASGAEGIWVQADAGSIRIYSVASQAERYAFIENNCVEDPDHRFGRDGTVAAFIDLRPLAGERVRLNSEGSDLRVVRENGVPPNYYVGPYDEGTLQAYLWSACSHSAENRPLGYARSNHCPCSDEPSHEPLDFEVGQNAFLQVNNAVQCCSYTQRFSLWKWVPST